MSVPRIIVLMSTYNGEKYVAKQLDSILCQDDVDVIIKIRDDGSKDKTLTIIDSYLTHNNNIDLLAAKNVGVKQSFRELILQAEECDYYAFADQDDIWYEDKLITAIEHIKLENKPALYFCNQNCVDSEGQFLFTRFSEDMKQRSYINTIFNNEYSGCTMVFNRKMMDLLKIIYQNASSTFNIMHDSVTLTVAQLVGAVYYDYTTYMDFRRHDSNFTQAKSFNSLNISERLKDLNHKIRTVAAYKKNRGNVREECKLLFNSLKDELDEEEKEILNYIASYCDNFGKYISFLLNNKLKEYFPTPRYIVYAKIAIGMY